jgi:hypothetical protein
MKLRFLSQTIAIVTVAFFVSFLVADALARGGGGRGGGGFSRSGPAAGGGFSSHSASAGGARAASIQAQPAQRSAARQDLSGDRSETRQARTETRGDTRTSGQEERTERTEARQEGRSERTEYRADAWDDHDCCWDDDRWGYALAGAAVGAAVGYAAATPNYVTALPCAPTVVSVNGASYYQCDSTWYNRTYVSGSLSYVVVDAPPGY